MFDVKSLPTWERAVRFVAALAMISCGLRFYGQPAGWAFFAFGAVSLVTRGCRVLSGLRLGRTTDAVWARQAQ